MLQKRDPNKVKGLFTFAVTVSQFQPQRFLHLASSIQHQP